MATKSHPASAEGRSDTALELTELLGYRLNRLSVAIGQRAALDAGAIAGLTLPEYRVTVALMSRGPLGVAGLQQAMLIDKAWISRTLASLSRKGLVESFDDPTDGRRTTFRLSRDGRRAASALIARARQRQERILRGFDDRERSRLFALLERVQRNVDEWER